MTQEEIEAAVADWTTLVCINYRTGKISEAKYLDQLEDIAVWARNAIRRLDDSAPVRAE
jgi:hypothetical protein